MFWCKHVGAEQLIETNLSISTSNWWICRLFLLHCPSLSLNLSSSNPDSMGEEFNSYYFSECTASRCKIPKKGKSFKETPCQWWCGQMCPSCLSLLLFRLFLLIASATQSISTLSRDCSDAPAKRASRGRLGPLSVRASQNQTGGEVLQMLEFCLSMLCACVYLLIKKENRQVFLADYILFFFCSLCLDCLIYTCMLLVSGWVHNALPRCPPNSMHIQPR